MLKSQEIQLAQSQRREQMAAIQSAETISDEGRTELRSLTEAYANAETEYRAAVILEDAERATIETKDKGETDFDAECRAFNLSNLVGALTDSKPLSGREAEVVAELETRNGASQKGIAFPWQALETRADAVTDSPASDDLASRPVMNALTRLFETSAAGRFGFQTVAVSGRPSWPEITAGASAHWVAEGSGADAEAIDTITKTPSLKTCTARYLLTRQSTKDNPALESVLRADLASVIREAVDKAAFIGAGGAEPTGLLGQLTAGSRVDTLPDPVTFSDLLSQSVDVMNSAKASDPKAVRMATQPAIFEGLADTLVTGTAVSELDRVRNTLGPLMFSRQTAEGDDRTVFFGAGEGLALIPTWGSPELIVDPYSESKTGKIALTVFTFADVLVRRLATHFYALHDAGV